MNSRQISTLAVLSLVACVLLGSILFSCSDSDETTGPSMVDINTYMNNLPAWDAFCPPVGDCDSAVGETIENLDMGQKLFCTTTPCSITETPDQLVTYGTFSNILWLGALIQGDSYAGGLGSMEELPIRQRAPLTIGVNFLSNDTITAVVSNPDAASVGQAVGTLIANAADSGYTGGSSIYFTQKEMYSLQQGMLSLGFSGRYMGTEIENKLDMSGTQKKHTITAFFKQFMFETFIVQPQTPADFFTDEFTTERLQQQVNAGNIGADNLPVYVSRIQWGRIMLLTMSSDYTALEMKNALKASHPSFGITMNAEYQNIIDNSEIEVVTFGGRDSDALRLLREDYDISAFFDSTAYLQSAFPIGYALNNLADNSPAKVGETTEYEKKECRQVTSQYYTDWAQWESNLSVIPDSNVNKFFATSAANVAKANEVYGIPGNNAQLNTHVLTWERANTGFDFDFYLRSLDVGCPQIRALTFNDTEFDIATGFISIGDVDDCQWDPFEIGASTSSDDHYVFAIGFTLGHNGQSRDEKFELFYGDQKLREIPWDSIPGTSFMGFVSAIPITKVVFTEGWDGDDIYVKDLTFGIAYRR